MVSLEYSHKKHAIFNYLVLAVKPTQRKIIFFLFNSGYKYNFPNNFVKRFIQILLCNTKKKNNKKVGFNRVRISKLSSIHIYHIYACNIYICRRITEFASETYWIV